jgi:exonuclease VII large subunit
MSEDTNTPVNEPTGSEPQVNEAEQRARDMGWVPKDEYTGDPVKWKSAEVFVALDEPIKRIESQSQELKQVKRALDALREHHTKVAENEYQRAIRDLKVQRKQALVEGDIDSFDRLEDEIEKAKDQFIEIKQQTVQEAQAPTEVIHPEFKTWLNRNAWYESYGYMRQFADDLGVKLHQKGLERAEVLKQVEQAVRKEFPNRFNNPNKANAPGVEEGGTKSGGKRGESFELNDQERNIMNTLVRSGTLTKEQYIAELKKTKGL